MCESVSMTAKEADRLAEWLKANGHSAEDVLKCIKYIAGNTAPEKG